MAKGEATREAVLDAFEDLLIEGGEPHATVRQIAERLGYSRGGISYHFPSKADLVDALADRLDERATAYSVGLMSAPEGAVRHYLRTADLPLSPLDRTILAAIRLASDSRTKLSEAFTRAQNEWLRILERATGDPTVARAVMLLGDGVHYHATIAALEGAGSSLTEVRRDPERLVELVEGLLADRGISPGRGVLG